jgi:uncharacterized membrane protein YjdF
MRKIDVFALVNTCLFMVLCVFRYYARFIQYRGSEHMEEFFIYGIVIICAIGVLWLTFRNYPFDGRVLVLLQIGIAMHFAGAFVRVDAGRLYEAVVLGIPYDKYVHFINSFGVTLLVARLFQIQRIVLSPINAVFMVMVVLGMGAVVEIVEYMVVLTIPHNGVGDYDNNMQDLIANLCGSATCMLLYIARVRAPRSGAIEIRARRITY